MKTVQVLDKKFALSIPEEKILAEVKRMAHEINENEEGKDVLFVAILNGSFMFASDLMKELEIPAPITFLKLASYEGTETTGNITKLIGLNESLEGRTVIILEDIVDSGITITNVVEMLKKLNAKEVKIATCFFKPNAYKGVYPLEYTGMVIPNDFIVGYGLDYNGYGRNLREIYTLVAE